MTRLAHLTLSLIRFRGVYCHTSIYFHAREIIGLALTKSKRIYI
jgi:hypothetical protein